MASMPQSLGRLLGGAASLLQIRAEQASLELAQARTQLARWAALGVTIAVLALLALGTASAWLAVLLWDRWGAATLLLLALAYGAATLWLLLRLRREIESAPPLLAQTLQELARDREALLAARRDEPPPGP
jgi:uncharacterized membrane protein YqjE